MGSDHDNMMLHVALMCSFCHYIFLSEAHHLGEEDGVRRQDVTRQPQASVSFSSLIAGVDTRLLNRLSSTRFFTSKTTF